MAFQRCKFNQYCSYEHTSTKKQDDRINALEVALNKKDEVVLELRKKVQILENLVLRKEEATIENTFDDDDNLDVSLKDLFLEENLFKCLHCGYKTSSKKGLKVHETRKHKKKCNN